MNDSVLKELRDSKQRLKYQEQIMNLILETVNFAVFMRHLKGDFS